jgi:hypothetical protein
MTRLPVSSTSAGERSSVISRVPKPSFATLTKGVTRMLYPHDEPPWTPQHTGALFRSFRTSAPPDFQRQILECVAQRQQAQEQRRMGWRLLQASWPGHRAWRAGMLRRHRRWPGHVIAMVGCCALVLGTGLAWWAMQTGLAAPLTPVLLVSRVVSQLPYTPGVPAEAPGRVHHPGGGGRAEPQEPTGHVASPLEPSASAPQMQTGQGMDGNTTSQAGDDPERALRMPVFVPYLSAPKVRHLPTHKLTQRSGRPRGEPGKSSRLRARPGTSQQAPG